MIVRTSLAEIRNSRGISAADLARSAGVTRQTIYAIEDGTFVPNTAVALRLARTLDVAVEEIFSVEDEEAVQPIKASLLSVGEANHGALTRLCRVKGRVIAVPASLPSAFFPSADGVVRQSNRQRSATVVSAGRIPDEGKRLLLAGCDPALSLLSEFLQPSGLEVINVPCSSRRALDWLKQGKIHAAGSHLLDRVTGDFNVPIVRRLLPRRNMRIVTFATWEQGLIVRPGNPKGIRSVADLAGNRITLMNRESGSGSRELLDSALRELGIPHDRVRGYQSIAAGHLAAAQAVASGLADCCIAPRSVARCFGLSFLGLAVQRFDLSFPESSLVLPAATALLDLLNRSALRKKLQCLAGYDTSHTGQTLM